LGERRRTEELDVEVVRAGRRGERRTTSERHGEEHDPESAKDSGESDPSERLDLTELGDGGDGASDDGDDGDCGYAGESVRRRGTEKGRKRTKNGGAGSVEGDCVESGGEGDEGRTTDEDAELGMWEEGKRVGSRGEAKERKKTGR
jgi:hypothetical protein